MRALTLATASLLLLTLAPASSALLPACDNADTTTSVNFVWTPSCLRIMSGDAITFDNVDAAPHNARSAQDDLVALRTLAPPCFVTPNVGDGRTTQVRFTHDSDSVTASVRNADGSWGPVNDCALAVQPGTMLLGDAVIPFECGIHQGMTGTIRVAALQ